MPPPLPFPFPLRIGTDICQISRINGILHTKAGRRFVERVLAPEELSHLAHTRPVLAEQVKDAAFRYVRKAAASHAGRRGWAVPPGVGHWEALEAAKKAAVRRPREVEREVEMKQKNEVGAEREVEAEREKEQDKEKAADWQAAVFMAGRWAAKEAAIKAHPHRRLGFHDIVILPNSSVEGEMKQQLMNWNPKAPMALIKGNGSTRDQMAMVSISHDAHYATASCIGFDAGPAGELGEGVSEPEPEPKNGFNFWRRLEPEPEPEPEPKPMEAFNFSQLSDPAPRRKSRRNPRPEPELKLMDGSTFSQTLQQEPTPKHKSKPQSKPKSKPKKGLFSWF